MGDGVKDIYRAIYALGTPVELTGPNNGVLEKYEGAGKITPSGEGDFWFEVGLHVQDKECNKDSFPYDVFVYSSKGILFPTNCYIVTAEALYTDDANDVSPLTQLVQDKVEENPQPWLTKNGRFASASCQSVAGLNVLQNGTCHEGKGQGVAGFVYWPKNDHEKTECDEGNETCRWVMFDDESLQRIDISPYDKALPHHVICESEGHLKPQEPINIGMGATNFAFIDGYLIYTQGEKVWALGSKIIKNSHSCESDQWRTCKFKPDQKRLVIKMKGEKNDQVGFFDVATTTYYPGYNEDSNGMIYFPDAYTSIRYPQAADRPVVASVDTTTDEAEGSLRKHVKLSLPEFLKEPPPPPLFSYLSPVGFINYGASENHVLILFGALLNYFPTTKYVDGLHPFIGMGLGFSSIKRNEEEDPKKQLGVGINLGLAWPPIVEFAEFGRIFEEATIGLWCGVGIGALDYCNITGDVAVLRFGPFSIGPYYAYTVNRPFGNFLGVNIGLFSERVMLPSKIPDEYIDNVEQTKRAFIW